MYEEFDDFLRIPTWFTRHHADEERFFRSLRRVVISENFNPDLLGDYIDPKRAKGEDAQARVGDDTYNSARDHYVKAAWAVYKYLRTQ